MPGDATNPIVRGRWSLRRSLLPTVLAGIGVLVLGGALAWFSVRSGRNPVEDLALLMAQLEVWLGRIPLPLYLLAFAILPAIGVPLSPFYLTIATVAGGIPQGIVAAIVCISSNTALSYWMTVTFARHRVERLVARRGIQMPSITPANQRTVTIILRASPLPYIIQNFVLALGGVSFWLYLYWSVLVQGMIGAGMIMVGGSLFEGNGRWALVGIVLFFSTIMIVSHWRRRQERKQNDGLESGTH